MLDILEVDAVPTEVIPVIDPHDDPVLILVEGGVSIQILLIMRDLVVLLLLRNSYLLGSHYRTWRDWP